MQNPKPLQINAFWDEEAKVWVASSDDVRGLATEAETMEALIQKLNVMVPELLDANDPDDRDEISFRVCSEYRTVAQRRVA